MAVPKAIEYKNKTSLLGEKNDYSQDQLKHKDDTVKNLLYSKPELYEQVFHGFDNAIPKMCEQMFYKYLNHYPSSILDIGSGTGRDLNYFSKSCSDCVGIDYQEQMVEYAKSKYPGVNFQTGNMETLRLDRTFEAIVCMSWPLNYALTNEAINNTLETFACHSQKGTLLIIEVINVMGYFPGGNLQTTQKFNIPSNEHKNCKGIAIFSFDHCRQLLIRERIWNIPRADYQQDYVKFRMLFPKELEYYLEVHGFDVLGMFDNTDLKLSGFERSLFVISVFIGKNNDAQSGLTDR